MKKLQSIIILSLFWLFSSSLITFGQCTYSICLHDDYGDGWNGGSVSVNVGGSTVISGATLNSGSGPSCYNFTVNEGQSITVYYTSGSWSYENYYRVYNSSGGAGTMIYGSTIGSTPPSTQSITNSCIDGGGSTSDCTNSICLYDDYGDGWNGGSVSVSVGGSTVISSATLNSGYGPTCYNFDVNEGDAISVSYSSGSYSYENYYQIFSGANGSGNSLYNSGEGYTPPSSQNITASCSGSNPPASDCMSALPFCTSDSYTFPASTNVPNMGSVGCLYTTPNPAWYWMEIGAPGNIDIYMSSGGDVDFIAWGPFTSLEAACSSNLMSNSGVDCSYSTAAQETANLTNTQTGEVYVLLITNYANIVTNISFSQTGGAGSTNCGIVAPPIINNGPLCEGETLQLTVSDPTAGATYMWSGPDGWTSTDMNPTINNVTTDNDGTYSLVISVGTETSPPVTTDVEIIPNELPTFTTPGPYCAGATIPSLPTNSNNGISGTWSPTINNTATTTYTFTPSAGQCALTTSMQIVVNENILPTFDQAGPYCYGTSIPPLPTNSTNGISGSWSPGINNTISGTYTFTPTAGQCATTTSMAIEIELLESEVISTSDQLCDAPGTATVSGINGTPDYTYAWPSTASGINNGTANQLDAGTYIVTIIDSHNCQTTQELTIGFTDNMTATAGLIQQPLCCYQNSGSIEVTISHGTQPFTIECDSSYHNSTTNCYNINNLYAGEHSINIYDANGCQASTSFTLENPPQLIASATYSQIPCAGDNSIVTVSATGGTPSYSGTGTYEVEAGTYSYTVTDNNGCTDVAQVTVPQAPAPLSTNPTISDITCFGANNGSISIITIGGTPPYNYNWSNEENTSTITNLADGNYEVTVSDYNNCSISEGFVITEPEKINLQYTIENLLCYGAANGVVQMEASGGSSPYSYEIYNLRFHADGQNHDNLSADTYTLSVRDSHNCQTTENIVITSPAEIFVTVETSNPSCIGNDDGYIEIFVNGGTEPYTYIFEGLELPLPLIDRLSKGTYDIEVRDAHSCSKKANLITLYDTPVDCIVIPNAFTPNGDGINDTWVIEGLEKFPKSTIQVFNRWGQNIFFSTPDFKEWDALYEGKRVPAGTYVYFLNLFNGDDPYTGTVTVVH